MKYKYTIFFVMLSMLCITDNIYAQGGINRPNTQSTVNSSANKPPVVKPRFTINGESKEIDLMFPDTGGEQTLTISTNQSAPYIVDLPYWITVENISKKSVTISCSSNNYSSSRSQSITAKSGKLSVMINVSQPGGYPYITKIDFANVTKDSKVINDHEETLYASDIRFLKPRVTYTGPGSSKSKTVYVKMFNADGQLMTGDSSPQGYTYTNDVTFQPGENVCYLSGWGNESTSAYGIGRYKIEIYCDGMLIGSETVMLHKKPDESSYLKVNNSTSPSENFPAKGASETFQVQTDGSEWSLIGVPSFCEVSTKTSTSFTLKCNPNIKTGSRSDFMFIKTKNQTVRLNLTQDAGTGAMINKVWVDHNVYENGEKGMKIHVHFETDGLKGHTIKPCVFFYYKNGAKVDGGSNYITPNGGATVQKSTISNYEHTVWKNYTLFMPYTKLLTNGSGKFEMKFYVGIIDKFTDKWVEESDYFYFDLSR